MKLYKLTNIIGVRYIAANTSIEALIVLNSATGEEISDFKFTDELEVVPESEWNKITISDNEFGYEDQYEDQTVSDWMKENTEPAIVASSPAFNE